MTVGNILIDSGEAINFISLDLSQVSNQSQVTVNLEMWDSAHKIRHYLPLNFQKDNNGKWRQMSCL